ncbi:hypothetical protein V8E52_007902 [Russula decolorans]
MFPIRPTLLPTFPLTSETTSPSPSPPPKEFPRHWDAALKTFFIAVGLSQCLAGLEVDILKKVVPEAIRDLQSSTSRQLSVQVNSTDPPKRPLEDRMLDYVRVERGSEVRLPSAGESNEVESASCARTDARMVDRDVMMKFDIAKNEEGPLRRTLKVEMKNENNRSADKTVEGDHSVTAGRHPGLDERLKILETHLAMRYVPPPPASLIHRIKFVEDHIIQLERKYPPWAALHFNQPRRGWPPPRRPTPVIAPSHLTANPVVDPSPASSSAAAESSISPVPTTYSGKAVAEIRTKGRASRSSLHRAVLEKLEVQRAIEDLKGESEDG